MYNSSVLHPQQRTQDFPPFFSVSYSCPPPSQPFSTMFYNLSFATQGQGFVIIWYYSIMFDTLDSLSSYYREVRSSSNCLLPSDLFYLTRHFPVPSTLKPTVWFYLFLSCTNFLYVSMEELLYLVICHWKLGWFPILANVLGIARI